jgi:hypothetical protein
MKLAKFATSIHLTHTPIVLARGDCEGVGEAVPLARGAVGAGLKIIGKIVVRVNVKEWNREKMA